MKTANRTTDKHRHSDQRCAADRIANRQEPAAKEPTWELYVGNIQLVIIGPGDNQWYPVSKAAYAGPTGTPEERLIATRAVAHLNANHADGEDVTKATITAIIKQSALGVTTL